MATLRPTFSESWYRVADLKVKLRGAAQISRQFYRGDRWYVVRDPAGNQFHRLSAPAYNFVGLLDGTRTVSEAWELVGGQLADDAPTQNEVIQILSQLHSANLIEANVSPDAAVLLRRHKKMIKRQWQGRFMNILFPRIPLWDCDNFLKRWMPAMRPLLSWFGVIVWLAVVIGAAASVAPRWPELQAAASGAIDPSNWIFLWASFVLIKVIHELGHGFATRRFGGEVHEMGVMFLVLVPCPYVDASTAWAFPNKWARIFVGAGGMIFELFIAAIMAFVWLNTNTGLLNHLAYNVMLIASVSTVIFNANPLLRYDGYYILSDWLEIPNLRHKSTEYTMGLFKRHLFGVKSPIPLPPPKQRFWLFFYAVASTIYRTMIGVAIILMVWQTVPVLGVVMAIGGVITWLAVPIVKLTKYLMLNAELHRKRLRAVAWTGGIAAGIFVAIGMIQFPIHYEALGIIEPANRLRVFTESSGVVDQILVRDGQTVEKGQPILICTDREQELEIAQFEARLNALRAKRQYGIAADPNLKLIVDKQIEVTNKELSRMKERQAKLTLTAPMSGRLSAPQLGHLKGKYLKEGEEIGFVATWENLRIVASIDQSDAAMVYRKGLAKGSQADIRPAGTLWARGSGVWGWKDQKATLEQLGDDANADWLRPAATWEVYHPALIINNGGNAEVDMTDPEGKKLVRPHVNVFMMMRNPGEEYMPGQRAHVRFEIGRQPLLTNWSRRIWQVIQAHSRGKWT